MSGWLLRDHQVVGEQSMAKTTGTRRPLESFLTGTDDLEKSAETKSEMMRLLFCGACWGFFTVFPALAMNDMSPPDKARLAELVFGEATAPYLQSAPGSLLLYLIGASFWTLPLLLLFFLLESPSSVMPAVGWRGFMTLLKTPCQWALLYLAGALVVGGVLWYRGDEAPLVWGGRLTAIGLLTGLPAASLVVFCRTVFRRRWLAVLVALSSLFALSIIARMPGAFSMPFLVPDVHRAQLLSGRVEMLPKAIVGLLAWSLVPPILAFGLATRRRRVTSLTSRAVVASALLAGLVACSEGSGGGTGSGGSMGASTGGVSQSPPDGWAEASEAERCALAIDNLGELCGDPVSDPEDREAFIEICVEDYSREASIGCGEAWDAYQACLATESSVDCEVEEPCSREVDAVFACRSSFAKRTGCVPAGNADQCDEERPVSLHCMGDLPAGCVEATSGVCCPAFQ